jgi:ABC-type polysaccharide/polyol phosphate transport system ATPase subunit
MNLINLRKISKKYPISYKKNKFILFPTNKKEYFYALKNIDLSIKKGECLGVIGPNGSGKTTLLKIIGNIIEPTSGKVVSGGKLLSFLDLGAGFQDELTGRENIFLYGTLLGMTKTEIKSKFNEILTFSELEKFSEVRLKNFSSGMKVRLAFAVAMSFNPDIFLIDEIISVGDEVFQKKSLNKIKTMSKAGKTIVLVSHNMNLIRDICDRVIYLNKGKLIKSGSPDNVIYTYFKDIAKSNYYNLELIEEKIKELNKLDIKIKRLEKGKKTRPNLNLVNLFRIDSTKHFASEKNKIALLKEEIIDKLRYTQNLMDKDLGIFVIE